jgi:serine protease Do
MPDGLNRTAYHSDNSTGWLVAIIVALALLAIGHLAFSANAQPTVTISERAPLSPHAKLVNNLGHGSSVHIGNGYYLTAAHVVVDPYSPGKLLETTVRLEDGRVQPSEILWVNSKYDVALLRADKYRVTAAPLDCSPVSVGDRVSAYGNPMMLEFVYTVGEIIGNERKVDHWPSAIPMSLSVAPGQSGGGILNDAGDVVGITVGTVVSQYGVVGVGMMVPSTTICMLMGRS